MSESINFWVPCFVNYNPPARLNENEHQVVFSYLNYDGDQWMIVFSKDLVDLEKPEVTGNALALNVLSPAFLKVVLTDDVDSEKVRVLVEGIENRHLWVPRDSLLKLTKSEALRKIEDPLEVERLWGAAQRIFAREDLSVAGELVINADTGLMEVVVTEDSPTSDKED